MTSDRADRGPSSSSIHTLSFPEPAPVPTAPDHMQSYITEEDTAQRGFTSTHSLLREMRK